MLQMMNKSQHKKVKMLCFKQHLVKTLKICRITKKNKIMSNIMTRYIGRSYKHKVTKAMNKGFQDFKLYFKH